MPSSENDNSVVLRLHVRGFPFPGSQWFYKEIIEEALDFQPKDTDILISTFPKCGTNWTKYIVWNLITRGAKPLHSSHQLTYEAVPFMDISGAKAAEVLADPRALHYHLPYHLIPKNSKAKYIYVLRNPKDVVVSFYHFTMQTDELDVSFDDYFETFMDGLTAYGDYFEHVLSWYEHRNDPNVLFISYEQIHADTKAMLMRIAAFLGPEHYEALANDDKLFDAILTSISFNEMKKLTKNLPQEKRKKALVNVSAPLPQHEVGHLRYFRKGIVGDWTNHLSVEQNARMERRIEEMFGGTCITDMINAKK